MDHQFCTTLAIVIDRHPGSSSATLSCYIQSKILHIHSDPLLHQAITIALKLKPPLNTMSWSRNLAGKTSSDVCSIKENKPRQRENR